MRVDISNGYVLIKDFINRKAERNWQRLLLEGAKEADEKDEDGKNKIKIMSLSLAAAVDQLVVDMIVKAVRITSDGQEQEVDITNTQEWVDELPVPDFDKISAAVKQIKDAKQEEEKKS